MSYEHLLIAFRAYHEAIKCQAERMLSLGNFALNIRSQFDSDSDFQSWLKAHAPQIAGDQSILSDAMDYALEVGSETSFSA